MLPRLPFASPPVCITTVVQSWFCWCGDTSREVGAGSGVASPIQDVGSVALQYTLCTDTHKGGRRAWLHQWPPHASVKSLIIETPSTQLFPLLRSRVLVEYPVLLHTVRSVGPHHTQSYVLLRMFAFLFHCSCALPVTASHGLLWTDSLPSAATPNLPICQKWCPPFRGRGSAAGGAQGEWPWGKYGQSA